MHFSAIWPLPPPFLHRKKGTARPPFSSFPPPGSFYTHHSVTAGAVLNFPLTCCRGRKGGREFGNVKKTKKLINMEGKNLGWQKCMRAKSTIISFFGIPVFFYSSVFLLQPNGILGKKIPYCLGILFKILLEK